MTMCTQMMEVMRCLRVTASSLLRHRRFHVSATEPDTQYHQITSQATGQQREIAYKKTPGPQKYGLVYIPGFLSNKGATKPKALHPFAQENGFSYVRYDPTGLGETRGVDLMETDFSMWVEDASEILQHVTEGPQIIVASSMGCWHVGGSVVHSASPSHHVGRFCCAEKGLTCLLASKFPDKIGGAVFLAPALNFHTRYEQMLLSQLSPGARQRYEEDRIVKLFVPDIGEIPLKREQIRSMGKFAVPLEKEDGVPLNCPVRIIFGMKDDRVPYMEALTIMKILKSSDIHLTYLKSGDHNLFDPDSLDVIQRSILTLNQRLMANHNSLFTTSSSF